MQHKLPIGWMELSGPPLALRTRPRWSAPAGQVYWVKRPIDQPDAWTITGNARSARRVI